MATQKERRFIFIFVLVTVTLLFSIVFIRNWLEFTHRVKIDLPVAQMETIRAGKKKKEVVLSDGSRAILSPNATLRYPLPFTGSERQVFVSGEVYFTIAKNDAMPFKVNKISGTD